jgi:hypothetical protein
LQSYRKTQSTSGTNVIVGCHICKICSANVRHDLTDLAAHFRHTLNEKKTFFVANDAFTF